MKWILVTYYSNKGNGTDSFADASQIEFRGNFEDEDFISLKEVHCEVADGRATYDNIDTGLTNTVYIL